MTLGNSYPFTHLKVSADRHIFLNSLGKQAYYLGIVEGKAWMLFDDKD